MASMKAEIKDDLVKQQREAERANSLAQQYEQPSEVHLDGPPMLAVSGVFYCSPIIGPQVLSKSEIEEAIEMFLWSQLAEEGELTAALMIQTLNKDKDKVKMCTDTVCKYLDNIITNPGEEKFTKIRINNKAFQDRVASLNGTQEFLQAIGFERIQLPGLNETLEDFYVMNEEKRLDTEGLVGAKETLLAAEPIKPELDRNLKVLKPVNMSAMRMEVPHEFYNISPEELKKEQQIRQEAVEKFGMLRTKEMREREQMRELRKYRFALIRIRFPDGLILQGTFRAMDKFATVVDFVRENLELDWIPFQINTSSGQKLTDENCTLAELGLAPAALVNFCFDKTVLAEVAAQQGSVQQVFLKQWLLEQVQNI